jgi:hypothetical protein
MVARVLRSMAARAWQGQVDLRPHCPNAAPPVKERAAPGNELKYDA